MILGIIGLVAFGAVTVMGIKSCVNPPKVGKNIYYLEDEDGKIKPVAVEPDSAEEREIQDRIYRETVQKKGVFYAWTTAGSPLLKSSNRYKILFWFLTFLMFPTVLKLVDFINNKKVRFIFLFVPFFILRLALKKYYGVSENETK